MSPTSPQSSEPRSLIRYGLVCFAITLIAMWTLYLVRGPVLLLYVVVTERWHWPKPVALAGAALFLIIDVAFIGANVLKVPQGGWVTLGAKAWWMAQKI